MIGARKRKNGNLSKSRLDLVCSGESKSPSEEMTFGLECEGESMLTGGGRAEGTACAKTMRQE